MLSTQEIYNFLVKAEGEGPPAEPAPLPPPLPPDALGATPSAANPMIDDESRIEGLRTRLLALIGPVAKKAGADMTGTVFGDTPGELDPEAEPLDPEWEEILESMLGDESVQPAEPTISLRPNKSMSRGAGGIS